MQTLFFNIVLLILGVGIYLSKYRGYIVHYLLSWVCFAPFIFYIVFGLENDDQYYGIIQWAKYLGLLIFVIQTAKYLFSKKRKTKRITVTWGILYVLLVIILFYSVFLAVVRRASLWNTVMYNFGAYFDLMILLGFYWIRIFKKSLLRFCKTVLWIEVIIALFQLVTGVSFINYSVVEGIGMTGTFAGANLLAEFISVLFFVVIYLESRKTGRVSLGNWVLFVLVTIITFFSGIRMALLSHLLIAVLLFYHIYGLRIKKKTLIAGVLVVAGIVAIVFTNYLSDASVTYDSQVSSAVERQNVLASIFLDSDYLSEHTTMSFTLYVLSFFPQNPVLGPGLLFTSATGYGGVVNAAGANLTDCTLALHVCEGGIIGIVLFVLVYFLLLKKICKNSTGAWLVFLYLLIVSITDPGLFFIGNYLGFAALILIEKRHVIFKTRPQQVLQPSVQTV